MGNELTLELALKMQSLFGDSIQSKDYWDGANPNGLWTEVK